MKIITFEDIAGLNISPAVCCDWVEYMIKNKNNAILPPKISMKPVEGTFCNVMPSIINGVNRGGVKVVTRYPQRLPSLSAQLLLFDSQTGDALAFMDATWITAMRTGAVAAYSIRLLAKTGYSTVAIMGLGNTARATLLMLLAAEPEKKLTVKLLKYKDQAELFQKRFEGCKNIEFVCTDSIEDFVKGSDVVVSCATYLRDDICPDSYFEKGVLVVPVHTRGFTNCDISFDKVFADDRGHVCHFGNFDKFKKFAEVSDIVNKTVKGRENDSERILAYNIGISLHDIYFAAKIYNMCLEKNIGTDIDMKEPKEKFWI